MLIPMLNLQAQFSNDTIIKIPSSIARKLLIDARQKDVLVEQVNILNERIAGLQSIIANLHEKDSATVVGYESQIRIMAEERIIFEDQISTLEKMLKKERRKRKWTAFGGIALTGIATYLYIIK